ncbi:putative homeodomain transcription factor 1 isoform X2 [Phycodurus eques]|uniref:putative homeodomain transcription factor 1 isoform X2 n=1 Tax=Phycodurus eques TaxID=693459 RepID=UPI002ACDFA26|nr:putative homeodomain transcription factor 1 isoform X2 [Phycodurus eques]
MARISWYQEKIGAYDQQIWEKSLEQTDLNGLDSKPRKTGHIKSDLIDVDLVRVAAVVLYVEVPGASASEAFGPLCLMLLLGTVHCQIVSTECSRWPSGGPAAGNGNSGSSPARRRRPRKGRAQKKLDEKNESEDKEPQLSSPFEDVQRANRMSKRKSGFGASDELSSEEEEGVQTVDVIPAVPWPPAAPPSSVRSRKSTTKAAVRPQEGAGAFKAKPREVERLRPSVGSRPASDTDDTMWEELLQGPDSASTGSSDSEGNGRFAGGLALQQTTTLSSDAESLQQGITGHQLSWLQPCHPSRDRVSAIIWELGECKKADMSVLEISGIILTRVKLAEQGVGYLVFGGLVTATLALLPFAFRLAQRLDMFSLGSPSAAELLEIAFSPASAHTYAFFFITTVLRVCLTGLFFFMMCVAERTYKQRLLFAKHFSHLTSARKAKKSEIPHFRLKKVQNIKMWLSLRSFLRRRGPQRSVDVIVSTIFLLALSISFIICAQLLQSHKTFLDSLTNWELMLWASSLVLFLLRLATLGSETNCKYSNSSVLLTEQINLYLKIEKKPNKKEELNIVNNVLKLATKLMKELDMPFRLLGLTVNPLIYNITRVVILSAVSAVVSDLLGFNIRLWKIKP